MVLYFLVYNLYVYKYIKTIIKIWEIMNRKIIELRLESSMDNLEYLYNSKIINKNIYSILKTMLNCRMESVSKNNTLNEMLYNFKNILINENNNILKKEKAVIGFSGGIDSTASTVILKNIFNIVGITAYSPIIMNNETKYNINKLIEKLQINHKYINVDIGEIENKVKLGHIHPCGRCHSVIENSIVNYSLDNNIKYIIYGDMLSVGPLSIVKTEQNLIRINILSFLAITK